MIRSANDKSWSCYVFVWLLKSMLDTLYVVIVVVRMTWGRIKYSLCDVG